MQRIKRLKNKTITEQVYEQLEQKIIFCEIEPGSVLTEQEISNMLGAGRTPVREALLLLSKRYLVNISKKGIVIPEINASLQLQLLEVRRAVLKVCVETAIKRMTKDDKNNLKELIVELDQIQDHQDKDFLQWLTKRQDILSKASKNFFIYEELRNTQGLARRFWYRHTTKEKYNEVKKLHKDILNAVYERETKEALECVDKIIDYFENFVKEHII